MRQDSLCTESKRVNPFTRITPLPRVAMLLVLLAGLSGLGVLTRLSLNAHRLQQQTARSLVSALATRIAARFVNDIQTQLYIGGTAILGRAGLGRMSTGETKHDAETILKAVAAVERCECAPVLRPGYAFTADLHTGRVQLAHPAANTAVASPDLAMLQTELRARQADGGWDFAIAHRLVPDGQLLFFARVAGDRDAIAGFAVDTMVVRYQILKSLYGHRAQILTSSGLAAADSQAFTLTVQLADGTTLAHYPAAKPANITGTASLPALFGGWQVTVGLNESVAGVAMGTVVARSPLTLMLVLAGLAAVALLIAYGAARRAAELAAMRAALISGMSHELRTPLTEILLVGESIQRGQYHDATELEHAVDVVVREARRLLRMISNVLQISVTGNETPLRGSRQRIGEEVRRVAEDFASIAAGYSCTLVVRIDDDELVVIDLEAIRQILNNFLDNACRYGGPGQSVHMTLHRQGDALRLDVSDSGPGIPASYREAVWQPFTRAPHAADKERFGSGIGLAVARQLATQYRGRTGIDPSTSGGACVYVEFPLDGVAS